MRRIKKICLSPWPIIHRWNPVMTRWQKGILPVWTDGSILSVLRVTLKNETLMVPLNRRCWRVRTMKLATGTSDVFGARIFSRLRPPAFMRDSNIQRYLSPATNNFLRLFSRISWRIWRLTNYRMVVTLGRWPENFAWQKSESDTEEVCLLIEPFLIDWRLKLLSRLQV